MSKIPNREQIVFPGPGSKVHEHLAFVGRIVDAVEAVTKGKVEYVTDESRIDHFANRLEPTEFAKALSERLGLTISPDMLLWEAGARLREAMEGGPTGSGSN
jgi:ActR/RegA family two-component response regulator